MCVMLKNIIQDQNIIKEQLSRLQSSSSSSSTHSFTDFIETDLTSIENTDGFNDSYTSKEKSSKSKKKSWTPLLDMTNEMQKVDDSRGNCNQSELTIIQITIVLSVTTCLFCVCFAFVWLEKTGSKRASTKVSSKDKKKIKLQNEIKQNQAQQTEIEQIEEYDDEIEKKYDAETSSAQEIEVVSSELDD
jgi:hypothetical protein